MGIEQWIQKDIPAKDNTPFIVYGTEGVGKKMFLVQWMKHHK